MGAWQAEHLVRDPEIILDLEERIQKTWSSPSLGYLLHPEGLLWARLCKIWGTQVITE